MRDHPQGLDTRGMGRDDQDQPGSRQHFRIWVEGRLDERFSEGLLGIEQEDVPAGTMLTKGS